MKSEIKFKNSDKNLSFPKFSEKNVFKENKLSLGIAIFMFFAIALVLRLVFFTDTFKSEPIEVVINEDINISGYKNVLLGEHIQDIAVDRKFFQSLEEKIDIGIFKDQPAYSKDKNQEEFVFKDEQIIMWLNYLPSSEKLYKIEVGKFYKDEDNCNNYAKRIKKALIQKYGTFLELDDPKYDSGFLHDRNDKKIGITCACSEKKAVYVNYTDKNLTNLVEKEKIDILKNDF